jgi:hypothetical protein
MMSTVLWKSTAFASSNKISTSENGVQYCFLGVSIDANDLRSSCRIGVFCVIPRAVQLPESSGTCDGPLCQATVLRCSSSRIRTRVLDGPIAPTAGRSRSAECCQGLRKAVPASNSRGKSFPGVACRARAQGSLPCESVAREVGFRRRPTHYITGAPTTG